jgi:hypothetical protein
LDRCRKVWLTLFALGRPIRRSAAGGVLRARARCGRQGGWHDVRTYEADLDLKLTDLAAQVQQAAYRALSSRRTNIPKLEGTQRTLAVAALWIKSSEGNRRGAELWLQGGVARTRLRFPAEARQAKCAGCALRWDHQQEGELHFDADVLNQEWLVHFVEHRNVDRRIVCLIRKWLRAGVLLASLLRSVPLHAILCDAAGP